MGIFQKFSVNLCTVCHNRSSKTEFQMSTEPPIVAFHWFKWHGSSVNRTSNLFDRIYKSIVVLKQIKQITFMYSYICSILILFFLLLLYIWCVLGYLQTCLLVSGLLTTPHSWVSSPKGNFFWCSVCSILYGSQTSR